MHKPDWFSWCPSCLGGVFLAVVALSSSATLLAEAVSPHAKVWAVPLGEVEWKDGFWAKRFATNRDRSLPAMWAIMKGTEYKPFLQNFLIAAGDAEGDYHGAQWNDGDFYKFLEAVTATYAVTHDPQQLAILDQSIDAI